MLLAVWLLVKVIEVFVYLMVSYEVYRGMKIITEVIHRPWDRETGPWIVGF